MDATLASILSPVTIGLLVLAVVVLFLAGPIARRRIPDGLDPPYPRDDGGRDGGSAGEDPPAGPRPGRPGRDGADYAPAPDPTRP
ncbi:hypothetical protein Bcav_2927 [Beutenbergia cavernae DSM 12333]|uniref:Uncharacterized protein n=1 Tax=Beutenbergia cavernae (strain ATCC BAA-8 / DSM 12333 / CCUG 43141 / JCM 11478 / NBRC 16432 / NCIMB 13614 / HKI 0122) TaxID=471853 RepID=C5BZ57_BEUC1|nr:hypothetical protein [Beutenbergia cavernae]ACQ81172.1 hypothetical protein Bcav_2927 [Beutenbergia cavernae DSM 12333]